MIPTPTEKKRRIHLEAMRIAAAFCVIFNHTGANGFFLFSQRAPGSVSFWFYLFLSVLCKFAVPLFFAISGAVMLNREEEPLGSIWRRRIAKTAVLILLFIFLNDAADALLGSGQFDPLQTLHSAYTGDLLGELTWYSHLWYLYAYIVFLISLPFLRALVQNLDTKYFTYLIILAVVFTGVIPTVEYLVFSDRVTLAGHLRPVWLLESIVLYPCIGYFLEHRLGEKIQKKPLCLIWLLNVITIVITCALIFREYQLTGILDEDHSQRFHSQFVVINCIAVFITLKYAFSRFTTPKWLESFILSLGKSTLGIYLIHIIVLESRPMSAVLGILARSGVNSMVCCLIQCGLTMMVCYGITQILLRIPFLKKLIGG